DATSKNLFHNYTSKNGLINNRVWAIEQDPEGNLWVGTFSGLSLLPYTNINGASFDSTRSDLFTDIPDYEELRTLRFYDLLSDKKGNIWCATIDGPMVILNENKELVTISELRGVLTRNFIIDKKSNIWIATYGQGISKISNKGLDLKNKKWEMQSFSVNEGLNSNLSVSILEDREGKIWIGNDESGIDKLNNLAFKAYTTKNGLKNDLVLAIVQDKDDNFIFNTFGGGISYFIPNSNKKALGITNIIEPHTVTPTGFIYNITKENGLLNNHTYPLLEDKKHNLWIANFRKGITKYSPTENENLLGILKTSNKKNIKYYSTDDGLSVNTVLAIFEDSNDNIWFGTASGASRLYKDENNKDVFESYSIDHGLKQNFLYTIKEDKRSILWFGTKGGGISYLMPNSLNNVKFKTLTTENGLGNNLVRTILEDARGNLWLGTNGGLSVFKVDEFLKNGEPQNDTTYFSNLTTNSGLSSDDIYLLVFDNDSSLWIGSSKGLDKFNYLEFIRNGKVSVRHYGKTEGLLGTEAALNAVCKDNEGNLWFGTVGGAIQYDPTEDIANTTEPLTHITRYRLFFRDTLMPQFVTLEYNKNHLTFDFIGISMTNPEKVRYRYKLEGFDNDWSPITKETFITYSNLHEGDYTFKIIACNNEGLWNKIPTTYSFTITPPFWRTWWFYLICVISSVVSISMFIKIRLKKLQEAKRILEAKVEERTVELKDKNAELAQKNKDIIDSIKYAKRIQEAILPRTDTIHEALPNSFILYKPKDIVSGDFYWFSKITVDNEDIVIIAAVDCTGHGVPGAFMSMIGNDLLNQIVIENRQTEPAKILEQLHVGVLTALKQTDEDSNTKDGMDIGLCAIKYAKREVQFAGAFRPLLILRDGELIEVKGDRYSIGGYQKEEVRTFTNHKLEIKENDIIYIFSDGCVDQFGGKYNKKFMSRRLKSTLIELQEKGMQVQEKIIGDILEKWRGDFEQTDDIIMIGIQFNGIGKTQKLKKEKTKEAEASTTPKINSIHHIHDLLKDDKLSLIIHDEFNDDLTNQLISLSEFNLKETDALKRAKKKISYLMIESFQNIIRHGEKDPDEDFHGIKGLFATRNIGDNIYISSANYTKKENVKIISEKIEEINNLSPEEIKNLYKESLLTTELSDSGGAGLGFIDMARKTGQKLDYQFVSEGDDKNMFFFQLKLESDREKEPKENEIQVPLSASIDLYKMMEKGNISMIYKGNFSQESVLPILNMIENRFAEASGQSSINKKVFMLLVELLQNIYRHGYSEHDQYAEGIFNIGSTEEHFFINCGNYISKSDEDELKSKIEALRTKGRDELQAMFKETIRRKDTSKGGSGLGLIKIFKDYSDEFSYEFSKIDDKISLYSTHVKVKK
ncbi:MAG: SiaB family protein kinase, partial [Bacteroidia bacterium]|nr:SiaB family protein kinase [Bacteroidia bacterium]